MIKLKLRNFIVFFVVVLFCFMFYWSFLSLSLFVSKSYVKSFKYNESIKILTLYNQVCVFCCDSDVYIQLGYAHLMKFINSDTYWDKNLNDIKRKYDISSVDLKFSFDSFSTALELNKNNPIAYFSIGNAYKNIAKDTEAIQFFEKALDLKDKGFRYPGNMDMLNLYLANLYRNSGNYGKAIIAYQRFIKDIEKSKYIPAERKHYWIESANKKIDEINLLILRSR